MVTVEVFMSYIEPSNFSEILFMGQPYVYGKAHLLLYIFIMDISISTSSVDVIFNISCVYHR